MSIYNEILQYEPWVDTNKDNQLNLVMKSSVNDKYAVRY